MVDNCQKIFVIDTKKVTFFEKIDDKLMTKLTNQ